MLIICPPYVLLEDCASNFCIERMQDSFAITFTNIYANTFKDFSLNTIQNYLKSFSLFYRN